MGKDEASKSPLLLPRHCSMQEASCYIVGPTSKINWSGEASLCSTYDLSVGTCNLKTCSMQEAYRHIVGSTSKIDWSSEASLCSTYDSSVDTCNLKRSNERRKRTLLPLLGVSLSSNSLLTTSLKTTFTLYHILHTCYLFPRTWSGCLSYKRSLSMP
jgi:hypothetical protein